MQTKELAMRTTGTHPTCDKSGKANGDRLPAGAGGTIYGASLSRNDLMPMPIPHLPDVSRRGGAVSGAAQAMAMGSGIENGEERAVALSDGSKISFASVAALGLFEDAINFAFLAGPADRRSTRAHGQKPCYLIVAGTKENGGHHVQGYSGPSG